MLDVFVTKVVDIADAMGYLGILIMMTLESCFIPFPSEVAMIPAWYLSSLGQMNFLLALFFWTLWVFFWSNINYFLWKYLWHSLIVSLITKYWKYFFIKVEDYLKAEAMFQKHWSITTFVGRLIPVIRQLISIPAWVFKMNYVKFITYTMIWGWLWNLILMLIWYIAWENKELIAEYSHFAIYGTIAFVVVLVIWYIFLNKSKKVK